MREAIDQHLVGLALHRRSRRLAKRALLQCSRLTRRSFGRRGVRDPEQISIAAIQEVGV
jgi:hypothetical protein